MIYAIIENGRVANLIVANEDFVIEQNLDAVDVSELQPRPELGDFYADGKFSKPVINEPEAL